MNNIDEPIFDAEFEGKRIESSQNQDLVERIEKLLQSQSFCVLCTQGEEQPYGSLIAYSFTDDLKHFFFTTSKATRKFKLLKDCQRVALLVDSRCQHLDDIIKVDAATITGKATEIQSSAEYKQGIKMLKSRHPYLAKFLDSETTALFRIDVVRYFHVTRFQEVNQWIP